MQKSFTSAGNWPDVVGSILLALLMLLLAQTALAGEGKAPIAAPLNGRVYKNLFEYRMCLITDTNWCPEGDNFKDTLFDELYANPNLGSEPAYYWEVGGVLTSTYPTATEGAQTRYAVDFCEAGEPKIDGTCPDVYDYEVVRCLDGTRPLFYYEEGAGAEAAKWLIKIQGGGHDCTENCPLRYLNPDARHDFSSAYGANPIRRGAGGIYSNSLDNKFKNYTVVMLDKCVGDRNLGDAVYTDAYTEPLGLADGSGPVYFHGYRIILATLRRLEREFGLADADQIIFMTQSNGSNGSYHYIDRLSTHVSATLGITAPVHLIAQSFFLPWPELEYYFEHSTWPTYYTDIPTSTAISPGIINAPNTPPSGACGPGFDRAEPFYSHWILDGLRVNGSMTCDRSDDEITEGGAHGKAYATQDFQDGEQANSFKIWGVDNGDTVSWDQSCLDAHASDPDKRACRDSGHVLSHHLNTPTFFALQSADRNLRHIAPYLTNWSPEATVYWPQDQKLRIEKLAEVIGGLQSGSTCADDDRGAHGLFIDNTVDHMSVTDWSKLTRQMKANRGLENGFYFQLQDYFKYWLHPGAPTVQCVDSNPIYDAEFMPPVVQPPTPVITYPVAEWPANLKCKLGYYDGGSQPYQQCDDPGFGDLSNPDLNKADPRWTCQAPPILEYIYLPMITKTSP